MTNKENINTEPRSSLTMVNGGKVEYDALFRRLFDNPSTLSPDEILHHVKNTFKGKLDREDMCLIAKIMLLQEPKSALRSYVISECDRNYEEANRLHDLLDRSDRLGIDAVKL